MKKSDKIFMSEEDATNSVALVNNILKFDKVWINIKDERAEQWLEGQRMKTKARPA